MLNPTSVDPTRGSRRIFTHRAGFADCLRTDPRPSAESVRPRTHFRCPASQFDSEL